jgi:hypothetical protein
MSALRIIEKTLQMVKTFKVGDHVSWNSEAGRVRGKIVKVQGGSVVAVPPPDHRGLPTRRRRGGISYSWTKNRRSSESDEGRHAEA